MSKDGFLLQQKNISNDSYKLSEYVVKKIENIMPLENLIAFSSEQVIDLVVRLKLRSVGMITDFLYIIGAYYRYIGCEDKYKMMLDIDRKEILKKSREVNSIKKFISYSEFNDLVFNIEMNEELNPLYYSALIQCIYEGIYSDNLSVIHNLKASDIHGNIVTLREDNGHVYDLEISNDLANKLIDLSMINTWSRKNRYNFFDIPIEGVSFDACFKLEKRYNSNSYKFSYFSRIRKISNNYMDYSLRPFYLYISGLMHRIKIELEKNGLTLDYAFAEERRLPLVRDIIENELKRCNYQSEVKNFRQIVSGFIKDFDD